MGLARARWATVAALFVLSCGQTKDELGAGDAGQSDSGPLNACPPFGVPLPAPRTPPPLTLALKHIDFGTAKHSGQWESVGFDLDCCVGDACADACAASLAGDDAEGRDNVFGGVLLPILGQGSLQVGSALNEAMASGTWTLMVEVGSSESSNFSWATSQTTPNFDGTDVWAVWEAPTSNAAARGGPGALAFFADEITLPLSPEYPSPRVTVHHAVVELFWQDETGEYRGTLGGVVSPAPLAHAAYEAIAAGDPNLCPTWFDDFATPYADSRLEGSGKCGYVSIGAAVSFVPASIGSSKLPVVPSDPVCF